MPLNTPWPNEPIKNIIIRMPNWVGDLVMATPILADLDNRWPEAKITAMVQSNLSPLLKFDPHIDEIYAFQKPSGWTHRKQHLAIIEPLQRGEFDLGLLLTNSFSSAWWFWRGHVKNRIGFGSFPRSLLLDRTVPFPKNRESQHLVLTYKHLLLEMGIPLSETEPHLYINETENLAALQLLQLHEIDPRSQIVVGINPGAAYGSAKCWLPERFTEVTARLLEDPRITIVYFGDQAGTPLVNSICSSFTERVLNLAGRTSLRELLALINCCSVFLTNDSGPMHIAAALGKPLLALFGSTSDTKTGPYPNGTVIHKHVECSPCYRKTCPIDFRCMTRITVDEVYTALMQLIERKPIKPRES